MIKFLRQGMFVWDDWPFVNLIQISHVNDYGASEFSYWHLKLWSEIGNMGSKVVFNFQKLYSILQSHV